MFQNRMWRKTRKPYGLLCYGSDPNRNWGYKWMGKCLIWISNGNLCAFLNEFYSIFSEGGASSNPCSETYGGSAAFSDVETKSLSQFITSISSKFSSYIAFHSYSQLLMFPYGHTKQHLGNYNDSVSKNLRKICHIKRNSSSEISIPSANISRHTRVYILYILIVRSKNSTLTLFVLKR